MRRSSSATRWRATCTSSSPRASTRPSRSPATRRSWTTWRTWWRWVRRLAESRAWHRAQHGAVRRTGVGRGRLSLDVALKRLLDPRGILNPGGSSRRPAEPHEEPRRAGRRRDRRQVHRVRLLRTGLPVARTTRHASASSCGATSRRSAPASTPPSWSATTATRASTPAPPPAYAPRCPVNINTGEAIRKLRGRRRPPRWWRHLAGAQLCRSHARCALRPARCRRRPAPACAPAARASRGLSQASGGRVPQCTPALPQPLRLAPPPARSTTSGRGWSISPPASRVPWARPSATKSEPLLDPAVCGKGRLPGGVPG